MRPQVIHFLATRKRTDDKTVPLCVCARVCLRVRGSHETSGAQDQDLAGAGGGAKDAALVRDEGTGAERAHGAEDATPPAPRGLHDPEARHVALLRRRAHVGEALGGLKGGLCGLLLACLAHDGKCLRRRQAAVDRALPVCVFACVKSPPQKKVMVATAGGKWGKGARARK